jgi:hypothetical protein
MDTVNTMIYVVQAIGAYHPTSTGEESCIAQVWPCECVPEFEDSIACAAIYSSEP